MYGHAAAPVSELAGRWKARCGTDRCRAACRLNPDLAGAWLRRRWAANRSVHRPLQRPIRKDTVMRTPTISTATAAKSTKTIGRTVLRVLRKAAPFAVGVALVATWVQVFSYLSA